MPYYFAGCILTHIHRLDAESPILIGGYEYNYQVTPDSLPVKLSGWTSSGLIAGLTKNFPFKGKLLKGSNLQLLWDFPKLQSPAQLLLNSESFIISKTKADRKNC